MKKYFLIATFLFTVVALGFSQGNSNTKILTDLSNNMVEIKAGSFVMGSPKSEDWREKDEEQHNVTLKSFYINKYEVSQGEYQAVMGTNPSQSTIAARNPVDSVSWYDAVLFCNKLSQIKKLTPAYTINGDEVLWNKNANGYRLPTEAEWEYACRAGTKTPFNTENSPSSSEVNYYGYYPYMIEDNYFATEKLETQPGVYRQKSVPLDSFKPNNYNLYNMHGNVSEWCWDFYGQYQTDGKTQNNPSGASEGFLRVCRGGGWNDFAKHTRSAFRSAQSPEDAFMSRGFRLAQNK